MLKTVIEPADFCILGEPTDCRLSNFERLTLTGGGDLERALNWASKQLENFDFTHKLGTFQADEFFNAAARYSCENSQNSEWFNQPRQFFKQPGSPSQVSEKVFHGLPDGHIVDLSFQSAYKTSQQDFQDELDASPENQIVHTRIWRHEDKQCPNLIAIHGWSMGDQRINSLAFLPGLFYQLGFNVSLIELPFHGRRKPKQSKLASDYMFPSMNLVRTNEAIAQAISDLRSLAAHIGQTSNGPVGCMGMSLGAYIGTLWASLDPLDFCVPIVPMVSMSELAWEIISRDQAFAALKESGLTIELLEKVFKVHCPLTYSPATPKERALIIAGIGDKIVPPRQPKLLWDHWKRPKIAWFQGGHVAQIKRSRAFKEVVSFFVDLKLIAKPSI